MGRTAGQPDLTSQIYRHPGSEDDGDAVSVILKLRGETCDIDCLYCYEKRKEAPGGARISADQVKRLPEIFRGRSLAVELHGGEPLTAVHPPTKAVTIPWITAGHSESNTSLPDHRSPDGWLGGRLLVTELRW